MNAPDAPMQRLLDALSQDEAVEAQEPTSEELEQFRATAAAILAEHRVVSGAALSDANLAAVLASWTCDLAVMLNRGESAVQVEIRGHDVVEALLGRPRHETDPWPLLLLEVVDGRLEAELGRVPAVAYRVEVRIEGDVAAVIPLSPDAEGVLVGSVLAEGADAQALTGSQVTVLLLHASDS